MSTTQPFLTTAQGTRRFACSAVAVQAIIVKADERVLLLSSPTKNRPDEWQVISGGLEVDKKYKSIFTLASQWCATLHIAAIPGLRMPRRREKGAVAGGFECKRLGTAGDGRQRTEDGTQDGRGSARTSRRGRHHGV